jgi:peptidoglycan hydrolase CwlO-like protein
MSNRAKNIVVFLTLSFLLTSCFNNTEEVVEDTTNDVNVEQTIDDINAEVDALEEEVNNKMEEANEAINNALDEANNAMDEVSEATGIDTPKVVKLDTVYTTPGGDHNITFVVNTM